MEWTRGVAKKTLPNGLTLLVQRDNSAPVAAVVTHITAGYFDEPDEWVGIAHVLEHMYFKGTPTRGPGAVARETQRLGGYVNAGTIYDRTVYYTVLPADAGGLSAALEIHADAVMNPAIDSDELARELEVIIQEAKRKLDTPAAVVRESLYQALFTRHRMRRWRIGTERGLRKLTAEDVRTYHETRYVPGNTIVAVVGDIDEAEAVAIAEESFGAWGARPVEIERSPSEPPGQESVLRVLSGDVQRPLAALGWKTVGALHCDAPALDVCAAVLGGGRGSWLYQDVRMPGFVTGASATHYTPTEVGVLDIFLQGEQERIEAGLERSRAVVGQLISRGPSDHDLERVRSMLEVQWSRSFEAMDGKARTLCEFEALGSFDLLDAYYRSLMSSDRKAVQEAASKYLDPELAAAVMYYPHGVTPAFDPDSWPPPLEMLEREVGDPTSARVVTAIAPVSSTVLVPELGGHVSLDAVDLLVRQKTGSGLVTIGLYFPWAPMQETPESAGISVLLARAALRGAGGLHAEQLAVAAENLGGALRPAVQREFLGWQMTVRRDSLAEAVSLLSMVAAEPELREGDIATERSLQASDAARVRDDMFQYPVQKVVAEALAGSAYALPILGEPDVVPGIETQIVRQWATRLTAARPVAVAVGDLGMNEMVDAIGSQLEWRDGSQPARCEVPTWRVASVVEERDKEQTAIAIAYPAVAFGSPDRYTAMIIAALLSGLAGKLVEALRERRALAYTVTASPWLKRSTGAMLTYIATSPEREEEARDAMAEELAVFAGERVRPGELERARNYAAGLEQIRQQSSSAIAADMLRYWLNDALGAYGKAAGMLGRVTADEVQRLAGVIFAPSKRAEFVVRGSRRAGETGEA